MIVRRDAQWNSIYDTTQYDSACDAVMPLGRSAAKMFVLSFALGHRWSCNQRVARAAVRW